MDAKICILRQNRDGFRVLLSMHDTFYMFISQRAAKRDRLYGKNELHKEMVKPCLIFPVIYCFFSFKSVAKYWQEIVSPSASFSLIRHLLSFLYFYCLISKLKQRIRMMKRMNILSQFSYRWNVIPLVHDDYTRWTQDIGI